MHAASGAAAVLCFLSIFLVPTPDAVAFQAGADVSWLPRDESAGAVYRVHGQPVDPIELLHYNDLSLVRLRLWHSPAEHWQGLDATLDFAEQVAAAGCDLMLDIHYSDTWADPGHQTKPAAWQGIPFDALVDSVYVYTNAVVRSFRDRGVPLKYVQIGNEISGGMLWDDGRVGGAWDTPEQWAKLCALLSAGAAAARDSLPAEERPGIVIDVDNGASNVLCRWFFDNITSGGVNFDAIGVSFYPWWHGTLSQLDANLRDVSARYGKQVMVVETAYPWTLGWCDDTHNPVGLPEQLLEGYAATPEGQLAFLSDLLDLVKAIPDSAGRGLIYWEPMAVCIDGGPGSSWENLALFDFDGDALPALEFARMGETSVNSDEEHGELPQPLPHAVLLPPEPNPFESEPRASSCTSSSPTP
jgi:arabinogalactan endo-1,4-beta-galactosidase